MPAKDLMLLLAAKNPIAISKKAGHEDPKKIGLI
jgi:hypothetical protein